MGSGGKAAGDRYAQRIEMADHFAQRGIFAAHVGQVRQPQFVQPQDVRSQNRSPGISAGFARIGRR